MRATTSIDLRDRPSLAGRIELLPDVLFFVLVVIPLLVVLFPTARRDLPYHIDPFTNAATAAQLGTAGTFSLDECAHVMAADFRGSVAWFVDSGGTAVSQYPPGAALWSAPFYAIAGGSVSEVEIVPGNVRDSFTAVVVPVPSLVPAAWAASIAVALAAGIVGLAIRPLSTSIRALGFAWLLALGTGAWGVAADAIWQHGPAMMWIALGILLASRGNYGFSGLSFVAAILTRTHTALIAAAIAIAVRFETRRWGPAVRVLTGVAAGLALLMAYNLHAFGSLSITGGYGPGFSERAASSNLLWWAGNVLGGLFDGRRGLLVLSPFLMVLIAGLPVAWRAATPVIRWSAVGGTAYLLVQYKANRFSGGDGFYGYRYPLEALTAASPLLFLAYAKWVVLRPSRLRWFVAAAATAVTLQAVLALR